MTFSHNQPGGVFYLPTQKSLSYSWAHMSGFTGAMHATASGGGCRAATLMHAAPMVRAVPKLNNEPYMSGGGIADLVKGIVNKVTEDQAKKSEQDAWDNAKYTPDTFEFPDFNTWRDNSREWHTLRKVHDLPKSIVDNLERKWAYEREVAYNNWLESRTRKVINERDMSEKRQALEQRYQQVVTNEDGRNAPAQIPMPLQQNQVYYGQAAPHLAADAEHQHWLATKAAMGLGLRHHPRKRRLNFASGIF